VTSRRSAVKSLLIGILAACDSTIARLKGRRLVAVAAIDTVRPDAAFRTTIGERPIIVVDDGGTTRTFVAVCTHEGCPLGWNPQQRLIRCPCHGSAFSTAGKVVNGPALLPLTELETFVERGKVLVAFPPGASS